MKKGVRFYDKKRKFSFEKKDNSMKRFDVQRLLSVRKMNREEKSNQDISKEIEDYFASPDKYFQKNSPVTVGKKIYILDMNDPRLRRNKKLKTEKKIATNFFNNLGNYNNSLGNSNNKNDNSSVSNYYKTKENQKYLEMTSKFEIIDNERLKMIFDSYKTKNQKYISLNDKSQPSSLSESFRNHLSENKRNSINTKQKYANASSSMENLPKEIKKCLFLQNRKLILQKLSEKKNLRISQFLSKKLNKPQNNLLINNIDSFRFKKEVINEIENNKPPEEQYGNFKWNISLRRPEHFKGVRDAYINLKGERFSPFWSVVIEKSPRQKELCVKPGHIINENEINQIKKINNSGIKKQYFKTVENLEDLSIEGKNLYNVEYKREIIDSKRRKILHKVFVDNGKAISSSDINNLYGNEILYKNYTECPTEKNIIQLKGLNLRD